MNRTKSRNRGDKPRKKRGGFAFIKSALSAFGNFSAPDALREGAPVIKKENFNDDLSNIEAKFKDAAERAKKIKKQLDTSESLQVYALFKQATVGPNQVPRPNPLRRKANYKWTAWYVRKDLPPVDAALAYIELIAKLEAQLGKNTEPVLDIPAGDEDDAFDTALDIRMSAKKARSLNEKRQTTDQLSKYLSANLSRDVTSGDDELPVPPSARPNGRGGSRALGNVVRQTVNFGALNGRKAGLRESYAITEEEFKRFTMFKVESMRIESVRIGSIRNSMVTFYQKAYVYGGPSFEELMKNEEGGANNASKATANNLLRMKDKYGRSDYKDVLAIVYRVSLVYTARVDDQGKGNQDAFAAASALNIPVDIFLFRLVRYLDKWFYEKPGVNSAGCRSLLVTTIYLQRIEKNMTDFSFTSLNIHRLLSVCMLLAAKFCEDSIIANSYWAEVSGVSMEELNTVEEIFCNKVDFDLYVDDHELDDLYRQYDMVRTRA